MFTPWGSGLAWLADKTAEAEERMREATNKRNELLAREEAARAAAGDAANAIKEAQVCRHALNGTTNRLHMLVTVAECQYVRIKPN